MILAGISSDPPCIERILKKHLPPTSFHFHHQKKLRNHRFHRPVTMVNHKIFSPRIQFSFYGSLSGSSVPGRMQPGTSSMNNNQWPRHPTKVFCPDCNTTVQTKLETYSTIVTMLFAILLFLLCFPLVVLPFCIRSCKRTVHYCPTCNRVLGERKEIL